MGIQFETDYNMETLTAMAKGLRKTVRKKRSRRVHIFAAVVLILGLLTILATTAGGEPLGVSGVVTLLAMLVVILVSLFEDRLNAWFARKRLLPGTEHAAATFEEDGYVSATGVTESRFSYAQIVAVAETARYFVFALSSHHTQAYDKRTIRGGSVEDFRAFIAEKTGKPIANIK
ncbi:MAG: YcxB family protein [Oscillospiraceae bacterium]|nr:YcxB family protein [Oscillospiraceae bacterium]